MDFEKEYKRKALEPIVSYIESVMASYSKEELEDLIKKALPERESEDERIRKRLVEYFNGYYDRFSSGNNVNVYWESLEVKAVIAWLEKQKEQGPAEWSEEDVEMLESIIKDYDYLCRIWLQDYEKRLGGADCEARIDIRNQITWLKSLRPQPHWKPSDEQIDALNSIILNGSFTYVGQVQDLISLKDDLKKLL